MRAVVIESFGEPDVLTVREVPDPEPGPDEVLVEVVSSALNRADLLQRRGLYPGPPAEFDIPGMEFAGRVVATGSRVTGRSVGDPIMGIVAGSAHAELLVVHERQTVPVPPAVPLDAAGAVPEVFITAFDALVVQGGLTSGRVALVHAGASGVGTAAIQIARSVGAEVIVTTSAGKVEACRELGATVVVDYGAADFVEACLAHTGGRGVDVVLDVVGGAYLDRNVRSLRVGGCVVQVGVMGGGQTSFNLGMLLPKRATVVGTVLRGRPLEEKIAITQRFGAEVVPLFADGRLHPVVDSRFPLDAVADAHRRMETNANVGKIVLDVCPA
jgi:putative PIG3 family NAD(P)H quinone oxidoreductase